MFVGIWELVKSIIDTIGKVLTGEIIEDAKALYEEFKNLDFSVVTRGTQETTEITIEVA